MIWSRPGKTGEHPSRRRAASGRGFTLVELMISLVAGLLVAMAVMGVSREATNTFHEEVRVSGAEMSIRIAMERLRMDIQRAAFMSTGNIVGDPLVARGSNPASASQLPYLSNAYAPVGSSGYIASELSTLTGVRLTVGGAYSGPDTVNNLTPDRIDLGGNFTSSDEYVASVIWPNQKSLAAAGTPTCGNGLSIALQMNTPAGGRIVAAEGATGNTGNVLQGLFHPGPTTGKITSQSMVRITDQSGRYQYALLAAGAAGTTTIYSAGGGTPTATICLDSGWGILKTSDTGGLGGVSGFGAGWVVVSPVEVVRWDIMPIATVTAAIAAAASAASLTTPSYSYTATALSDAGPMAPGSELVLTRSYVDFSQSPVGASYTQSGSTPPDYLTTEIIAEYAVDMKFGVTYDLYAACSAYPCPTSAPPYTSTAPQSVTCPVQSGTATEFPLCTIPVDQMNATATSGGTSFFGQTSTTYTASVGPQRIRNLQVRLGVRSQFADRTVNIQPPDSGAGGYLYRYLLPNAPGSGAGTAPLIYARVRENTSDVNVPNQARFYY